MNHVQQFELMEKMASPRWAKMLSLLSNSNKNRLAQYLPAGVSRRVGPEMGRGAEGRIYPAFSGGGIGDSVTKVFNDAPAFTPGGLAKPSLGKITGGDAGVQKVLGGMSIGARVKLMRKYPEIFPTVHNQHARGYTMERLVPIPESATHPGTRSYIRNAISEIRFETKMRDKYRDIMEAYAPKSRGFGAKLLGRPPEKPDPKYTDYIDRVNTVTNSINKRKQEIGDLWKVRNQGMASPSHPIMRLSKDLLNLTGKRRGTTPITHGTSAPSPMLTLGNKPVRINDFGSVFGRNSNTGLHNIMRTQQGRAVISDPVPIGLSPSPVAPWTPVSSSPWAPRMLANPALSTYKGGLTTSVRRSNKTRNPTTE